MERHPGEPTTNTSESTDEQDVDDLQKKIFWEQLREQQRREAEARMASMLNGMGALAEFSFAAYSAYVTAGFDEDQALMLTMDMQEIIMGIPKR